MSALLLLERPPRPPETAQLLLKLRVPMATGPDTTNLQPTAKSCLSYANDPVRPFRGLHPTLTQCRLWVLQCPRLAPPTHRHVPQETAGSQACLFLSQEGRNTAEGLLFGDFLKPTLWHTCAATHTITHTHTCPIHPVWLLTSLPQPPCGTSPVP